VKPMTPAQQDSAKKRAKKVHRAHASARSCASPTLCAHPAGYACDVEAQPEPGWHFWNPPAPEEAGADFEALPEPTWVTAREPEPDWVLVA